MRALTPCSPPLPFALDPFPFDPPPCERAHRRYLKAETVARPAPMVEQAIRRLWQSLSLRVLQDDADSGADTAKPVRLAGDGAQPSLPFLNDSFTIVYADWERSKLLSICDPAVMQVRPRCSLHGKRKRVDGS